MFAGFHDNGHRGRARRRPVSVNIDSSLSNLAKALITSKEGLFSCSRVRLVNFDLIVWLDCWLEPSLVTRFGGLVSEIKSSLVYKFNKFIITHSAMSPHTTMLTVWFASSLNQIWTYLISIFQLQFSLCPGMCLGYQLRLVQNSFMSPPTTTLESADCQQCIDTTGHQGSCSQLDRCWRPSCLLSKVQWPSEYKLCLHY